MFSKKVYKYAYSLYNRDFVLLTFSFVLYSNNTVMLFFTKLNIGELLI